MQRCLACTFLPCRCLGQKWPETTLIPLKPEYLGLSAIVDTKDVERLMTCGLIWRAVRRVSPSGNHVKWYAAADKRINGIRKTIYMHRYLEGEPVGKVVDHEDNNGLNNVEKNRKVVTQQKNMERVKGWVKRGTQDAALA